MEQRRKAMLEMPKLIRAWKSVSTLFLLLYMPVIITDSGGKQQVGKRNWTKFPK
jgi:hypothetical protein